MTTNDAQAAFVERLERHRGILVKVVNAYCRDAVAREDLIQEIAAALWRAYPRFDGRAAFSTWTYRIAVNVAISFYRSETRKARNVELADRATLEGSQRRKSRRTSRRLGSCTSSSTGSTI
jgi:RNA polymerase sigma factor (sigma-70 family)